MGHFKNEVHYQLNYQEFFQKMHTLAIKTHRIEAMDTLQGILDQYLPALVEESIVVLTSKIISTIQGRVVPKDNISKRALIEQEADYILQTPDNPYDVYLTLKETILIPNAGIDESNGEGVYILYPQHIQEIAATLWTYLRTRHNLKNLGVIITDSHTTPLRRGVTGIALGWCGFDPVYSYQGRPDLYGHPLRVTQINILDALAASAVFVMGEGNEQTPLALIQDAPRILFVDRPPTCQEHKSVFIPLEQDLYAPLLKGAHWRKT